MGHEFDISKFVAKVNPYLVNNKQPQSEKSSSTELTAEQTSTETTVSDKELLESANFYAGMGLEINKTACTKPATSTSETSLADTIHNDPVLEEAYNNYIKNPEYACKTSLTNINLNKYFSDFNDDSEGMGRFYAAYNEGTNIIQDTQDRMSKFDMDNLFAA